MGSIRTFNPVKLFVGVLASEEGRLAEVESRLTAEYGPIDLRSSDHSLRVFFSFERLVDAERLPDIKLWTNNLESETSLARAPNTTKVVKRPVNLDPGYLENSKVVLASTKNFYHRMYLGRGIFAEVTMHFGQHVWEFFPWTHPDYQSEEHQKFFLELRGLYRTQLKAMCLLKGR